MGNGITDSRCRGKGKIHDAKRNVESSCGFRADKLTHSCDLEGCLLDHFSDLIHGGILAGFLDCHAHDARSGNTDIDNGIRLRDAMETAGHEGIVLHGIAEDHELGGCLTVPVLGHFSTFTHDLSHELYRIHVDAGLCGADVDAGTYYIRLRQGLRYGTDQFFITLCHALLDQGGISADEIDTKCLCGLVQCPCIFNGISAACTLQQGDWCHGDPLVYNRNTVFHGKIFCSLYQVLCL